MSLSDALEDARSDVQNVYSNFDVDEEEVAALGLGETDRF